MGFSGALVPGPLFAVTVSESMRLRRNIGFRIVSGHAIAEIILVAVIALGLSYMFECVEVRLALGIVGGGFLIFTAYGLLTYPMKDMDQHLRLNTRSNPGSLPILGFLTSFSNPYFTIWWASIGSLLAAESLMLAGYIGLAIFLVSHWCSDFSWYMLVSFLSYKGSLKFGSKPMKIAMYICGVLVASLAVYYITDAVLTLIRISA
ncbi:MAG: LysE family translocator [Candidatus Bathyarchaeota archaeon]|nr:LysE family translocator [Candidatus Bathyarchaeota archaeon]